MSTRSLYHHRQHWHSFCCGVIQAFSISLRGTWYCCVTRVRNLVCCDFRARVQSNNHNINLDDVLRFPFKTGIYAFKQGNKQMSQKLMRGRVAAQGFTILVMTAGLYMAGPPEVCGETDLFFFNLTRFDPFRKGIFLCFR